MKKMIQDGVITQHEYDTYLKLKNENNTDNIGYAFVTYSLTDQTKLAIMLSHEMELREGKLEVFLKGQLDHSDLDKRWTANKMKNDSKLVDEIERLREAKKELRDFERNID